MADFDTTLANLGVNRYGTAQQTGTTSASMQTSMTQADFLTLMTAQLKNQDPFDPVDNTQMVAQMAQFSSLAGISEMNSTLKSISERLGTPTMNDAMAWVGRAVMTEGDMAWPNSAGTLEGAIELDDDAANVTLTIRNADGALLRTVSLGQQEQGTVAYSWDGTTDTGEEAGEGPFTIQVSARSSGGTAVAARNLVWAPVTAAALGSDGNPVLTLPGIGQVPVSAVRKIG